MRSAAGARMMGADSLIRPCRVPEVCMSESILAELLWASQLLESHSLLAFLLPASVDMDAILRAHLARGVHHGRQFLRARRSPEGLRHLLHARREIRAAIAIIGEWSGAA
jgi:hypothetical protein